MPRYYRRVIRITAEDSPNVRLGLAYKRAGKQPPKSLVVPGVLPYDDYVKRRTTWDEVRQCIGLDAQFYEGAEVLMFPPQWLNKSEAVAAKLVGRFRTALGLGCDPGEGGDNTTWAVVDEYGLIELISKKTPDTSVITGETLALMRKYNLKPHRIMFDRGGGGKQAADRLRLQGYNVSTVAFGESVTPKPRHGVTPIKQVEENKEEKYTYLNRRAEMYGKLRLLLDPTEAILTKTGEIFAIPAKYSELRRQLSLIPLTYDEEGRLYLLPKNKKGKESKKKTLREILGCSPDEADALVLGIHAIKSKDNSFVAGVAF